MKLMKKSLSIVLAVIMLASVCSCLLVSNVGAYTVANDNVLALDFENGKGIADIRVYNDGKHFEFEYAEGVQKDGTIGTYPLFTSHTYQGWSVVFGNENAEHAVSVSNKPHADRFQVTEAGTYTLTFDYKYIAGSSHPNARDISASYFYFNVYRCQIADPTNSVGKAGGAQVASVSFKNLQEGVDYEVVDGKDINDVDYTYGKLLKDTEWATVTAEVVFSEDDISAGRTSICLTLSAGADELVGDFGGNFSAAIDNVTVAKKAAYTATNTETYVYDFKDEVGRLANYSDCGHANFSGSDATGGNAKGSKVTSEGLLLSSDNSGFPSGGYNWGYKAYLKDPDFKLGNDASSHGFLRIEADSTYYISMKFKLGPVGGQANTNVGIGLTTGTEAGTVMIGTKIGTSLAIPYNDTDWHTVSVVIDSDVGFVKADDTSNVGKYVCIMAKSGEASFVLVESVTVTVVDKTKDITQADSVVATFDNGLNDVYMPQGNALNNGTYSIVDDPLDSGRGNVLKFVSNMGSTSNLGMPQVTGLGGYNTGLDIGDGYKPQAGRTYRISFDMYLGNEHSTADSLGFSGISAYIAKKTGIANSGDKQQLTLANSAQLSKNVRLSYIQGQWANVTYEMTYNASDLANYPYIIIAYSANIKDITLYLDNISITDVTEEDTANGTVILDSMRGSMNADSTVTLPTGTVYEMPIPQRDGYVFAGWTKNWNVAVSTTIQSDTKAVNDIMQTTIQMGDYSATKTVIKVEPGVTRYYAVWAKASQTYEFNDLTDKYLAVTIGDTAAVPYSSGDTYGEDLDGDGDYDAFGLNKADKSYNQYAFCLGETVTYGKFTVFNMNKLHEGVTYKVTFNKKVDKLGSNGKASIGINRGYAGGYGNVAIEGGNTYKSNELKTFTAAETDYSEWSYTFSVYGINNTSYNGAPDGSGASLSYKDNLHINVFQGSVLFDSITVEAISYDDGRVKVNGGEAEVYFDYANKTVDVFPAEGYTVGSNGVQLFNNKYFGLASDYSNAAIAYNKYATAECVSISAFRFSFDNDVLFTPDDPSSIRVVVDLVPETYKRSIRAEGTVGGKYQSAGLRFRYTLTDEMKAGATEIGFIASPDASSHDWYIDLENSKAKKAVVFDGTVDKVYQAGEGTTDYQLLITGLTREDETEKNAKDMNIFVVMYVTTAEGTEYYFVGVSSYNDVKAAYAENGTITDGNGNNY